MHLGVDNEILTPDGGTIHPDIGLIITSAHHPPGGVHHPADLLKIDIGALAQTETNTENPYNATIVKNMDILPKIVGTEKIDYQQKIAIPNKNTKQTQYVQSVQKIWKINENMKQIQQPNQKMDPNIICIQK